MLELDNHVEENEKDYDLLAIDEESDDTTIDSDEEVEEEIELEDADADIPEQTSEESSESDESQEQQESLDDLEVKYLHEVKKLKDIPKDEVKTLVQKGMNHDRLVEKIEGYKTLETNMAGFEEIATLYNMDVETLKNSLLNQFFEQKASEEGLTAELVEREYRIEKKEKSERTAEQEKELQTKKINAFVEKYPNVNNEDIKPETWERFSQGEDLITAYEKQVKDDEINALKLKLAEVEGKQKTNNQNAETKKKAVVKSTLSNGSDDPDKNDDFLQGLFGS